MWVHHLRGWGNDVPTVICGHPSKHDALNETMLVYCWPNVCDAGPTLNQHCFNALCLLGWAYVAPVSSIIPSWQLWCHKHWEWPWTLPRGSYVPCSKVVDSRRTTCMQAVKVNRGNTVPKVGATLVVFLSLHVAYSYRRHFAKLFCESGGDWPINDRCKDRNYYPFRAGIDCRRRM